MQNMIKDRFIENIKASLNFYVKERTQIRSHFKKEVQPDR